MAATRPAKRIGENRASTQAGMFYFRRDRGSYLLTNDWGHFARLSEKDFKRLLAD